VDPAYPLPQPPERANEAGVWLLNAWNEAMGAIPNWPLRQPAPGSDEPPLQTLYGRRRLDWFSRHANGFAQELSKNALVQRMSGKRLTCTRGRSGESAATEPLELHNTGDAALGRRRGRWGAMNDPTIGEALCPVNSCLFVDLMGQQMNAFAGAGGVVKMYRAHYHVRSAAERAQPEWICRES